MGEYKYLYQGDNEIESESVINGPAKPNWGVGNWSKILRKAITERFIFLLCSVGKRCI